MSYVEGPLNFSDGSPVIPEGMPHSCMYPSKWRGAYSHTTVATLLINSEGNIAATVERRPDEPAEPGRLVLPGGYVELGDTVFGTAEKEVEEETGYSIIPGSLHYFAMLDGPLHLPGRANEHNFNIVHAFTAHVDRKVREHDDEVTGVYWIGRNSMPRPEQFGFGHYDIVGMWFRHLVRPFSGLLIPSTMPPDKHKDLFLPGWHDR